MDTPGRKSLYTALSNSMIGVLLLAGGAFGLMADLLGPAWVLATFALMSAAGAATAWQLREVQQEDGNSA
jgi:membrane-bound ClpP family serine protease